LILFIHNKAFIYCCNQNTKLTETELLSINAITVHGKISETQNHDLSLQQPKENNYNGKVYFLMNGRSFSGTAEFAATAKSNSRGLFIGEETHGGYYGNTSGGEAMVTLPNTQIICRVPLINYFMAVKKSRYAR